MERARPTSLRAIEVILAAIAACSPSEESAAPQLEGGAGPIEAAVVQMQPNGSDAMVAQIVPEGGRADGSIDSAPPANWYSPMFSRRRRVLIDARLA